MMIEIIALNSFKKEYKKLKKRYKRIDSDIISIEEDIVYNPKSGIDLGEGFYKTRVKNSDKNRGKSGGYRIITYYIDDDGVVYLVSIYDKGDKDSVSVEQLKEIIKKEL